MAKFLPEMEHRPSTGEKLGNAIGGLGKSFSNYIVGESQRQKENEFVKNNLGIDISSIHNPNMREKALSNALAFGQKNQMSKATQNVQYGNEIQNEEPPPQRRNRSTEMGNFLEENKPSARQKLPENAIQNIQEKNNFFPDVVGNKETPGNLPQPQTKGNIYPLATPQEIEQNGTRIAKERTAQGIPTTKDEGIQLALKNEQQKQLYNQNVEADTEQRVKSQEKYGQIAESALLKLLPKATDEQRAYFMKKGEEKAGENKSEADIKRIVAAEARKFKNTIANVKKSVPAPRLLQNIKSNILGESREFDKVRNDIRIKLQPLLKEGLYDTSRNLLSGLGYHPEERESIITDLGENTKKTLAQLPKIEKPKKSLKQHAIELGAKGLGQAFLGETGSAIASRLAEQETNYNEQDIEKINQNIEDVFKNDPSTNLILLRKAYEEKGVDWQTFKDSLNNLIFDGQIKLNDDQFSQLDTMDYAPLNNLEKILHGLKLIGR